MTSQNETTVTADLRRKLTATTALVNVLRNIHASRSALIEAVQELDSDNDAFDPDEFDGGSAVRRTLKDAVIANNAATLEVEENVFETLEEVLSEADDAVDEIDSGAADSVERIADQATTITEQSTKIEELTGELAEANSALEAFTAPGAEVLHVDSLIIAVFIELDEVEDEAGAGTGEEADTGAGVGAEAEGGAGNGEGGSVGEAGAGEQVHVEAPVEE